MPISPELKQWNEEQLAKMTPSERQFWADYHESWSKIRTNRLKGELKGFSKFVVWWSALVRMANHARGLLNKFRKIFARYYTSRTHSAKNEVA